MCVCLVLGVEHVHVRREEFRMKANLMDMKHNCNQINGGKGHNWMRWRVGGRGKGKWGGGGGGNISYLTNNFIMVGCLFVDQSQCITSSLPGVRSYQE